MNKLASLPNTGFAPNNDAIAKHMHEQADWIAAEDSAQIRNVIVVIEYADGTLLRQTYGMQCDLARAVGLLMVAAARASIGDEE